MSTLLQAVKEAQHDEHQVLPVIQMGAEL